MNDCPFRDPGKQKKPERPPIPCGQPRSGVYSPRSPCPLGLMDVSADEGEEEDGFDYVGGGGRDNMGRVLHILERPVHWDIHVDVPMFDGEVKFKLRSTDT